MTTSALPAPTRDELLARLRAPGAPVLVFGAGPVGWATLAACRALGIDVAALVDNNRAKLAPAVAGRPEVLHASELPARFPDARILVAVIAVGDVVGQLTASGYARLDSPLPLLDDGAALAAMAASGAGSGDSTDWFYQYVLDSFRRGHENYLHPGRLYLRSIDAVLTTRCTLRCRDCSNLMQYYQHPAHLDAGLLLEDIAKLCDAADAIHEFRVIGGEPFTHPEWPRVAAALLAEEKVAHVVLYTNATLLPDVRALEALRHPKALFYVTDYGPGLSRRCGELLDVLRRLDIAFHVDRATAWTDCGGIEPRRRTDDEHRAVFAACCAKHLYTLLDGRLYLCPFAAHAEALGAVPETPADRVDVRSGGDLRAALSAFSAVRTPVTACAYCSGRPHDAPVIPAARQAAKPVPVIGCADCR